MGGGGTGTAGAAPSISEGGEAHFSGGADTCGRSGARVSPLMSRGSSAGGGGAGSGVGGSGGVATAFAAASASPGSSVGGGGTFVDAHGQVTYTVLRIEQFLRAALHAAADMEGLSRQSFRLLLMRFHQFLDVSTVLRKINDPQQPLRFADFERVISERPHRLALTPNGRALSQHALFYNGLCVPGSDHVPFERLAQWSCRAQLVRPGAGAAVPQPRWVPHWAEPSTVAHDGRYSTPRAAARGVTYDDHGTPRLRRYRAPPSPPPPAPPPPPPHGEGFRAVECLPPKDSSPDTALRVHRPSPRHRKPPSPQLKAARSCAVAHLGYLEGLSPLHTSYPPSARRDLLKRVSDASVDPFAYRLTSGG